LKRGLGEKKKGGKLSGDGSRARKRIALPPKCETSGDRGKKDRSPSEESPSGRRKIIIRRTLQGKCQPVTTSRSPKRKGEQNPIVMVDTIAAQKAVPTNSPKNKIKKK